MEQRQQALSEQRTRIMERADRNNELLTKNVYTDWKDYVGDEPVGAK